MWISILSVLNGFIVSSIVSAIGTQFLGTDGSMFFFWWLISSIFTIAMLMIFDV